MKKLDLIIEALTEASQIVATGNWGTDYYACCGADIEFDHLDGCIILKALDAAKQLWNEFYARSRP